MPFFTHLNFCVALISICVIFLAGVKPAVADRVGVMIYLLHDCWACSSYVKSPTLGLAVSLTII